MNFFGKVLIVLIFAASVVFMGFSMSLCMSQRNFREDVTRDKAQVTHNKALGLKFQLENAKSLNESLKKEKDELQAQYDAEKAAQIQALCKLQVEFDQMKKERRVMETQRVALEKKKRDIVAAMDDTQKNSTNFLAQVKQKKSDIAQAQKDRDDHLKQVVSKTDEYNQAVNEKETHRRRMADLAKDLAKAVKCLQ